MLHGIHNSCYLVKNMNVLVGDSSKYPKSATLMELFGCTNRTLHLIYKTKYVLRKPSCLLQQNVHSVLWISCGVGFLTVSVKTVPRCPLSHLIIHLFIYSKFSDIWDNDVINYLKKEWNQFFCYFKRSSIFLYKQVSHFWHLCLVF